ncbi:MAG: nitroreductase family protein [Firmicutes bacterium]|nr:nitroreductase family protein [Bacillota bacterium]
MEMTLKEAIEGRRSIRRYKPDPIPEDDIREMVRLATLAPSGSNKQMWKFVAVTNKEVLQKMAQAVSDAVDIMASWPEAEGRERRILGIKNYSLFFTEAPVTFAVFMEPYQSAADTIMKDHGLNREEINHLRGAPDFQSIGAAIQNLLLVAHAMGYGGCWMCGPVAAADEINKILEVKPPYSLVALVPVGVPDEDPPARPRKPLDEVFTLVK